MHSNEYICRICGYKDKSIRWEYCNNTLCPHYIICNCCGAESGLEDSWDEGIRNYRNKWLEQGASWFDKESKPDNWDLKKQLLQIPKKYK